MKQKIGFYVIFFLLLSLGPIAVLKNTNFALLDNNLVLINTIQRVVGLVAFTLMFIQIILGFFMVRLTEKFGGWIFNFHILEGIFAYFLIILHPLLFIIFNYLAGRGADPFYVFTDFCAICKPISELYYTFGRIAFWLLTASVFAGLFRTSYPWLRSNWRKLHILNYLSFILIAIHSLGVGSDVGTFPFSLIHGPSLIIVAGLGIFKIYSSLKKSH